MEWNLKNTHKTWKTVFSLSVVSSTMQILIQQIPFVHKKKKQSSHKADRYQRNRALTMILLLTHCIALSNSLCVL